MDTPNTRSRRKREVNDEEAQDEGGTVEWQHDQRLRRMMVEAAVGVTIAPPTPTQQPNFSAHPQNSSASAEAGPSSRPMRKRPCRAHRSLPSQLSNIATPTHQSMDSKTSARRTSSAPLNAVKDGLLDDLLNRAFKTFSVQSPLTAAPRRDESKRVPRPLGAETQSAGPGPSFTRSDTHESTDTRIARTAPQRTTLTERSMNNASSSRPITRRTPSKAEQVTDSLAHSGKEWPPKHLRTSDQAVQSVSPRVGSSARLTACPSARTDGYGSPTAVHRFKPPLLRPPTRSSPRRSPLSAASVAAPIRSVQAGPHTPSRLAVKATGRSESTSARITRISPRNTAIPQLRDQKVDDAPSSDSAGNESFDSFDGMFQAGGEDIEALLRAVDGS